MTIDVVLVDDQALVRSGFAMLVGSQRDLRVVGEAADGLEALDLLARVTADVVLMDVRMPRLDGVEATRRIVAAHPGRPRILVLTTFDLDEYAFAALQAGASGFLLKDALPEDLLRAIRTVHAGDAVVAPSTTRRLIAHYLRAGPHALPESPESPESPGADALGRPGPAGEAAEAIRTLTEREREVWLEIARGLTNGEIAAELGISEATVKSHVGSVLAKTASRDRVALVLLAYERGLLPAD
jgi:DNA-binding NarL/FixJ family response regulator